MPACLFNSGITKPACIPINLEDIPKTKSWSKQQSAIGEKFISIKKQLKHLHIIQAYACLLSFFLNWKKKNL
jgi:hypothetical protein